MLFAIQINSDTIDLVRELHGDPIELTPPVILWWVGSTDPTHLNMILPEEVLYGSFIFVKKPDPNGINVIQSLEGDHKIAEPTSEWETKEAWRVEPGDRFPIGDILYVCHRSVNNMRGCRVIDSVPLGGNGLGIDPTTLIVDLHAPISVLRR